MREETLATAACTGIDPDWSGLSHQDILRLNTYDFMAFLGKRVINPGGLRGRDQILSLLAPAPGSRVLEIGGGGGHAACHIASKYRCEVTTVDISPRSVREAKRLVAARGLGHAVHCEVGDVSRLGFADASFDYVIGQAVLMFVPQKRALGEIHRVLRRGGRLGGLEFCWRRPPSAEVRQATYAICGCQTLEFHSLAGWQQCLQATGFALTHSSEHPFRLLSLRGFVRDEGLANSLRIAAKVLRRRANRLRMGEIWTHFSRNIECFSYSVFTGEKR